MEGGCTEAARRLRRFCKKIMSERVHRDCKEAARRLQGASMLTVIRSHGCQINKIQMVASMIRICEEVVMHACARSVIA